jgi:hypothetical protein
MLLMAHRASPRTPFHAQPRRAAARFTLPRSLAIGMVLLFALARVAVAAAVCAPLPEACPTGAPAMPVQHHDQRSAHPLDDERGGVCASQVMASANVTGIAAADHALDAAAAPPMVGLTVARASFAVRLAHAERRFSPPSPLALFSRLRL